MKGNELMATNSIFPKKKEKKSPRNQKLFFISKCIFWRDHKTKSNGTYSVLMPRGQHKKYHETCEFQNEEKSAASFCHEVAAQFPDMFCNFYLEKNHNIAKNSTAIKAREKMNTDLVMCASLYVKHKRRESE